MVRRLFILLLLVGCGFGSGEAAARESGPPDQGLVGAEATVQKCRNVHKRDGVLVGECRQSDGSWRRMRLDAVKGCEGRNRKDIACAGAS
jgi:hypothetical protein